VKKSIKTEDISKKSEENQYLGRKRTKLD